MKKETIVQIVLKADEGKVLTDGENFGTTIVLPETAKAEVWYEINQEETQAKFFEGEKI